MNRAIRSAVDTFGRVEGDVYAVAVAAHDGHVGIGDNKRGVFEIHDEPPIAAHAFAQVAEGAVAEHASLADHHHPPAELFDVVHVVRREDDGHPVLGVQALDEVAHRELGDGVEPDRRLVEDGIIHMKERSGKLAAHLLTQTELPHRNVEQGR